MRPIAQHLQVRRSYLHKARRRLKRTLLASFKGRRRKSTLPRAESPRWRRSREDQITMEVLRYRVDHPDAVAKLADGETYSDAFKDFLLNQYEKERHKLRRRQFARAAEIPVATLRIWLAQPPRPLLADLDAIAPIIPVQSLGVATPLKKWAKALGPAAKGIRAWVGKQLTPEPMLLIVGFSGYGAIELRKNYQKYVVRGLVLATVLNALALMTYWVILKEDEAMRTVIIMKYLELPNVESEEPQNEIKKTGESTADVSGPGTDIQGKNVVATPDQEFIPMADVAIAPEVAQLAQLGRPSLPSGGTALANLVTSSNPLAMPDLNVASIGSIGTSTPSTTDGHDPAAFGLPLGPVGKGYTPGLQKAKVGYGGSGGTDYATGRDRGTTGSERGSFRPVPERKNLPPVVEKVVIKEKNLANVDFDKIFRELVDWLEMNHSDLSLTVSKYLGYKPGDLTGAVRIATSPVNYDLFILCNAKSQDIGILLVAEGDSTSAILLRDTGFRKKSFYLSKGLAVRDDDAVVFLSMLEVSPTTAETSSFYNIFLSWWGERNKPQ